MALPAEVLDPAISLVATYCATKVPAAHDDKLRIEYKVRGNTITIYECRPPWRAGPGGGSALSSGTRGPASGRSTRATETTVDWSTRSSNPCPTWRHCSASSTAEILEARRIDDEAAAIALERIRSDAAEEGEDGRWSRCWSSS